jgi:Galactose binding lectin domain
MTMRTVLAAVIAAASLSACVAYDMDNPALYDDPARAARVNADPFARDPFAGEVGYVVRYDRFGRPVYVPVAPDRYYGGGYYGGGYGRPERHERHDRPKRRMTIEDAQYESVNGQRIDANRYVRDECDGENNCDVKASNKKFGDPDVGAHKDLIVRYRCGKGPSRTVRVPEKSEQDIRC